MKQNLNCSGSTRVDGGEYGEVRVSASLRVDGDLRCDALQCSGSAKSEGGKQRGKAFTVVSNPEFLREGTSVHDYLNPPLTLIGTDCEYAEQKFRELYKDINAEFVCTDIKVAEMMKYVNNTYHALNIFFGN